MREFLLPAVAVAVVQAFLAPFPGTGDNPYLDLIAFYDPAIHTVIRAWYYASPAAAVLLAGGLLLSIWRVWLEPLGWSRRRGKLPPWPTSPGDAEPSIVVGELHHPTAPRESDRPSWLTVPETGLYTGVLVVGAVGSGKTSACMYPFASQILSWQADRPDRRAAGLILEVKGDFCHSVRRILEEAGRGDDYLEIGLDGAWQWNPLDDPLLDTYSLAYTVSTLINQLFGKSREPLWDLIRSTTSRGAPPHFRNTARPASVPPVTELNGRRGMATTRVVEGGGRYLAIVAANRCSAADALKARHDA